MGAVAVSRTGICHNYKWTIDWLQTGGDRPPITLNTIRVKVTMNTRAQRLKRCDNSQKQLRDSIHEPVKTAMQMVAVLSTVNDDG